MHLECSFCGSRRLRRSRFRPIYLFPMLFLHYPVRCLECYRKSSRFILLLFLIQGDKQKSVA